MLVKPYMGLVVWDSINDYFSHVQLKSNFEALDIHDHTSGKGKQIPYGGLAEQSVGPENLRGITIPIKWYTPKTITEESSREGTTFATMTAADQINGVAVAANQIVLVGYSAIWKSSVSAAGRAALFFNENQFKSARLIGDPPAVQELATNGIVTNYVFSQPGGLGNSGTSGAFAGASFVTTGMDFGGNTGGFTLVERLAAGTYNVSVRYRATSGTVSTKERSMWVAVLG